jgi:hypothetical protein
LRNEANAELHRLFSEIVKKYKAGTLGITDLFNTRYLPALAVLLALLDPLRRSELTVEIEAQDARRDTTLQGLVRTVQGLTYHPDETIRAAAIRVKVLLDHYGNIRERAYNEQSAAIDDLLRELRTAEHAPLIATLGLASWLTALETDNNKFVELVLARHAEAVNRPDVDMKSARATLDAILREILDRIEAQVTLYGMTSASADYKPFILEWNDLATRYKNILAQERGRRAKKNDEV